MAASFHKVLSALPGTLEPDAVYFVKNGAVVQQYVTTSGGSPVAHLVGSAGGGTQQVFVQQTRPVEPGPWVWWETDALGNYVDLTVNDGA